MLSSLISAQNIHCWLLLDAIPRSAKSLCLKAEIRKTATSPVKYKPHSSL